MSKWNQKSGTSKGLAIVSILMFSNLVHASIDLSPKLGVEFKSSRGAVVVAYPILGDCKTWHYIPTKLYGRGNINHQIRRTRIKEPLGIGLVNAFEFQAHSDLSDGDLESLKKTIFERASISSHCLSSEEKAGMLDGARSTAIIRPKSVSEVSITSAFVKASGTVLENDEQSDIVYFRLAPTQSSKDSWDRASESKSLTLFSDATDRTSLQDSTRKLLGRQDLIGKIKYSVDGVLASVDAWIKLKAEMKLEFVSFMNRECSDVSKRGDAGAMIIGYAIAGVPGAIVGGLTEQKTKHCVAKLETYFKGGDISGIFENNIGEINDKDENGEPIMIETCNDKGQCGNPVSIQNYVKAELIYGYMASGFLNMINRGIEESFKSEKGKNGTVTTKFNFLTSAKRAFYGRRIFEVNVISDGLSLAQTSTAAATVLACAQSKYDEQSGDLAHVNLLGVSPMPVHPACLKRN